MPSACLGGRVFLFGDERCRGDPICHSHGEVRYASDGGAFRVKKNNFSFTDNAFVGYEFVPQSSLAAAPSANLRRCSPVQWKASLPVGARSQAVRKQGRSWHGEAN